MRLNSVVAEVFEAAALMAGDHIQLVNSVDKLISIDADREHLIRILTNLTRNSIQALETIQKAEKKVSISATREGNVAAIEVADNGPGIPKNIRARVFEAFQSSARAGGTGLGLAISAELVQAHGGTICVADSTEAGTVFKVTIPDRIDDLLNRNGRALKKMNS